MDSALTRRGASVSSRATVPLPTATAIDRRLLIGAALFGGTFIGLVSLVLTMAGRFYPTRPAKMMGKMTIAYGVAQIAAPAVTGLLAEQSGTYADGLYLAAAVMMLGTPNCLVMPCTRLAKLTVLPRGPYLNFF